MENKVCAIICEYNPMHTGHIHQINEIKKKLGEETFVVGLMSGNFSQRAKPCLFNKYDRTTIALNNDVDMVINLPTLFTIQSAEIFAYSSIKILNQIKVDYLCFGMENPNLELLFAVAKYLVDEPLPYKQILKSELKSGKDYNTSVKNALLKNSNFFTLATKDEINNLLSFPNNILAIEYAKALIKTNSKIKPIAIRRVNNYNNENIVQNFVSSSALRNAKDFLNYKKFLPENSLKYFKKSRPNLNKFNDYLFSNLKLNLLQKEKKNQLANRVKKIILNEYNFENFNSNLKTKCYKQSYLDSFYLNSLFNISEEKIKKIYTIKTNIYVKILGIKDNRQDIFKYISTKNLILRKNDVLKIKQNSYNGIIQEIENKANILYNLISEEKTLSENDYFSKLILV